MMKRPVREDGAFRFLSLALPALRFDCTYWFIRWIFLEGMSVYSSKYLQRKDSEGDFEIRVKNNAYIPRIHICYYYSLLTFYFVLRFGGKLKMSYLCSTIQ